MGQTKRDAKVINTKVDAIKQQRLGDNLLRWGYIYRRQGEETPLWGVFLEAIADAVVSEDGENVVLVIPRKTSCPPEISLTPSPGKRLRIKKK